MKICVFGAASKEIDDKYMEAVENLGAFLAENGHDLVFGSGKTGNMGAVARGFRKGGGKTYGVIPEFFKEDVLTEYVDYNCDEMIYTDSMRERKAVMENISDAFVITPGGCGTFEEFFEVLTLKQLGRHRKPIAIYNIDGYFDRMSETMMHSISEGFMKKNCTALYRVFDSFDGMLAYLENDDMEGLTLRDFK